MAAFGTEGETEDERGGWVGEGYETKLTCRPKPAVHVSPTVVFPRSNLPSPQIQTQGLIASIFQPSGFPVSFSRAALCHCQVFCLTMCGPNAEAEAERVAKS